MCSRGLFLTGNRVVLPYPIRRRLSSPRGGAVARLLITTSAIIKAARPCGSHACCSVSCRGVSALLFFSLGSHAPRRYTVY
jgi:hypothetical protein